MNLTTKETICTLAGMTLELIERYRAASAGIIYSTPGEVDQNALKELDKECQRYHSIYNGLIALNSTGQ